MYGIGNLTRDLDALVDSEKDPRQIIGKASDILRSLITTPDAIPAEFLKT